MFCFLFVLEGGPWGGGMSTERKVLLQFTPKVCNENRDTITETKAFSLSLTMGMKYQHMSHFQLSVKKNRWKQLVPAQ